MAQSERLLFKDEWKVNTLDIAIGVVLGVVQAVVIVTGALDYLSRLGWTLGLAGIVMAMFVASFYGTLVITSGFLRKRILVMVMAGTVVALLRWFTGDPNGPAHLIFWTIGAAIAGVIFWLFRWKDGWWRYGITGAILEGWTFGTWFLIFGLNTMGWTTYLLAQVTIMIFGFFTCGLLGYGLGKALQRVGVSVVER